MSSDVSESNNKRKREINDEENHVDKLIRRTTNINKSALDKTKWVHISNAAQLFIGNILLVVHNLPV